MYCEIVNFYETAIYQNIVNKEIINKKVSEIDQIPILILKELNAIYYFYQLKLYKKIKLGLFKSKRICYNHFHADVVHW